MKTVSGVFVIVATLAISALVLTGGAYSLTSSVDISGNRMPFQLRKGDVLIQCTDGLYRYLPDSTMCRILAVTGNLKQAAEQMVKTALAVPGGHDNTSVLLARYKG